MVAAVLFDLDETLLDRTSSLRRFLADQHARFFTSGGHVSFEQFCERFLALDRRGLVQKSVVYPTLLQELGAPAHLAEALLLDYRDRCCLFAGGFPDVADVVSRLRVMGLKLGIVTNGHAEFQSRHIDALNLREVMDTILISEVEGLRKPDVRLFHRAAARLEIESGACLFVGDNPEADILGAHGAGMQTAWFSNGRSWPADIAPLPGHQIDRLLDLLSIVGESERSRP